jgi:hypothetical protein
MGTVCFTGIRTRGRTRTCGGALNRRLRCRFATLVCEPLDRLERSSPGYGPGASPSTLEGQRSTVIPPDDRRLADVRSAVCQRGILPPVTKARASRRSVASRFIRPKPSGCPTNHQRGRSRSQLQGSESNRRGPAYEAGLGASTRPAKEPLSAQRESNPLLRTGKPACSLEHLGRETIGVEGRDRARVCTGLQPMALPSWRPRQVSEQSQAWAHHRTPGTARC